MKKTILSSTIGTVIEWAEFTFYAYMAVQFATLFFPMLNHSLALLATLTAFAISYLARPLGGIIFGILGDKQGRKNSLSSSIIMMGIVTLCIGLLPTYQQIGVISPILLIILRFLQGIAVSGEFTNAAIFLVESSHKRKSFSASFVATSAACGMLIGALFALIISLPGMPTWSWRIPFIFGFLASLLGFYIRQNLAESPSYQLLKHNQQLEKTPIRYSIRHHKKALSHVFFIAAFVGIYIYICNLWWVSYVGTQHFFNYLTARSLATFAQLWVVLLIPCTAWLTENYNQTNVLTAGLIGAIIIAPTLFFTSQYGSLLITGGCEILYAVCNALVSASMFKYIAGLFPTKIRCSAPAVSWNVSVALLGGTAPLIAQYAIKLQFHNLPAIYVVLSALVTLFIIHSIKIEKTYV